MWIILLLQRWIRPRITEKYFPNEINLQFFSPFDMRKTYPASLRKSFLIFSLARSPTTPIPTAWGSRIADLDGSLAWQLNFCLSFGSLSFPWDLWNPGSPAREEFLERHRCPNTFFLLFGQRAARPTRAAFENSYRAGGESFPKQRMAGGLPRKIDSGATLC